MKTKYAFISLFYMVSGLRIFGESSQNLEMYAKSSFINAVKTVIEVRNASFGSKEYDALLLARLSSFENPGLALQSIMQNARRNRIETYIIAVDNYISIEWRWEDVDRHKMVYAAIEATYDDSWRPKTVVSSISSKVLPPEEKPVPAGVFK